MFSAPSETSIWFGRGPMPLWCLFLSLFGIFLCPFPPVPVRLCFRFFLSGCLCRFLCCFAALLGPVFYSLFSFFFVLSFGSLFSSLIHFSMVWLDLAIQPILTPHWVYWAWCCVCHYAKWLLVRGGHLDPSAGYSRLPPITFITLGHSRLTSCKHGGQGLS